MRNRNIPHLYISSILRLRVPQLVFKLIPSFPAYRLKQPAFRLSSIVQGRNIPLAWRSLSVLATVSSENKAISDAARAFHRVHVPAVSRRLCIHSPTFSSRRNKCPACLPSGSYCSRGGGGGGDGTRPRRNVNKERKPGR